MIAIRLLKLELKYSKKSYIKTIDSWLNKLKLELNSLMQKMK